MNRHFHRVFLLIKLCLIVLCINISKIKWTESLKNKEQKINEYIGDSGVLPFLNVRKKKNHSKNERKTSLLLIYKYQISRPSIEHQVFGLPQPSIEPIALPYLADALRVMPHRTKSKHPVEAAFNMVQLYHKQLFYLFTSRSTHFNLKIVNKINS